MRSVITIQTLLILILVANPLLGQEPSDEKDYERDPEYITKSLISEVVESYSIAINMGGIWVVSGADRHKMENLKDAVDFYIGNWAKSRLGDGRVRVHESIQVVITDGLDVDAKVEQVIRITADTEYHGYIYFWTSGHGVVYRNPHRLVRIDDYRGKQEKEKP